MKIGKEFIFVENGALSGTDMKQFGIMEQMALLAVNIRKKKGIPDKIEKRWDKFKHIQIL